MLVPLAVLEAPTETEGEAFADFLPEFVGAWIDDKVVAADVIGNMFVETRFEPSNTVKGMSSVIYATRVWRAAKVVAFYALIF